MQHCMAHASGEEKLHDALIGYVVIAQQLTPRFGEKAYNVMIGHAAE